MRFRSEGRGSLKNNSESLRKTIASRSAARRLSTGSNVETSQATVSPLKRTMSDMTSEKNGSMQRWLKAKKEAKQRQTRRHNPVSRGRPRRTPQNNQRPSQSASPTSSTTSENCFSKPENRTVREKSNKNDIIIRPPSRVGPPARVLPSPIMSASPYYNNNSKAQQNNHEEDDPSKSALYTTLEQMKKDISQRMVPDLPPLPTDGSGELNVVLESVEKELETILKEQQELHDTLNSYPGSPSFKAGQKGVGHAKKDEIYKSKILERMENVHNEFNKLEHHFDEDSAQLETESASSISSSASHNSQHCAKSITKNLFRAKANSHELKNLVDNLQSKQNLHDSNTYCQDSKVHLNSSLAERFDQIRRELDAKEEQLESKERIIIGLHREMEALQHSRFDGVHLLKEQILDLKSHLRQQETIKIKHLENYYQERMAFLEEKVDYLRQSKDMADNQLEVALNLVNTSKSALVDMRKSLQDKENAISALRARSTDPDQETPGMKQIEDHNTEMSNRMIQLEQSQLKLQKLVNSMEKQWSMLSFEVEEMAADSVTKEDMVAKLKFFLADRDSYHGVLGKNLSDGEESFAFEDETIEKKETSKLLIEEDIRQQVMDATLTMDNRFEKMINEILECLDQVNVTSESEEETDSEDENEDEFGNSTGLISEGLLKRLKQQVERVVSIFKEIVEDDDTTAASKCRHFESKVENYAKEVEQLQSQLQSKVQEEQGAQATIDVLVEKLYAKSKEYQKQSERIEELQAQNSDLLELSASVEKKKNADFQQLEQQSHTSEEELSVWKARAREVEESLRVTRQQLDQQTLDYETSKRQATSKISNLEEQLKTLERQLQEAKSTVITQANNLEEFQVEKDQLHSRIDELLDIEEHQKYSLTEREKITGELIAAKEELSEKQDELERALEFKAALEEYKAKSIEKDRQISRLKEALEQEQTTVTELGEQLQSLENENESQRQDFSAQINNLESEIEQWKQEFENAKSQVERVADFSEQYVILSQREIEKQFRTRFSAVGRLQSKLGELRQNLQFTESEKEQLKSEIHNLNAIITDLKEKRHIEQEKVMQQSETQMSNFQTEISEQKSINIALTSKVAELQAEISSLQANEKQNAEHNSSIVKENENLQQELNSLKNRREQETATLSAELERLNSEIVELQSKTSSDNNSPADSQADTETTQTKEVRGVQTAEDEDNSSKVAVLNQQIELMQQELEYYRKNSVETSYFEHYQQQSQQYIRQIEEELKAKNSILQQLQDAGLASGEESFEHYMFPQGNSQLMLSSENSTKNSFANENSLDISAPFLPEKENEMQSVQHNLSTTQNVEDDNNRDDINDELDSNDNDDHKMQHSSEDEGSYSSIEDMEFEIYDENEDLFDIVDKNRSVKGLEETHDTSNQVGKSSTTSNSSKSSATSQGDTDEDYSDTEEIVTPRARLLPDDSESDPE